MNRKRKIYFSLAGIVAVPTFFLFIHAHNEAEERDWNCKEADGVLVRTTGGNYICIDKEVIIGEN